MFHMVESGGLLGPVLGPVGLAIAVGLSVQNASAATQSALLGVGQRSGVVFVDCRSLLLERYGEGLVVGSRSNWAGY